VKLIENIAAQLPPNCYLYVKDHPHISFYREIVDYRRIKAIPNVKLLNPSTPGKLIIRNCMGLITINGTSGFEAMLLGKQVYTFGNAFYSSFHRVKRILHIRDLREELYKNYGVEYVDDSDLLKYLSAYLISVHMGFTDYFVNYPEIYSIDKVENAKIVAKGLRAFCLEN
jgi:capsule polysaccharide export protein KpsC/LpsZ